MDTKGQEMTRIRMNRSWVVLVSLSVMGIGMAGCRPKVWVESQEQIIVPLASIEKLSVLTHNGHIVVKADPASNEIKIEVSKRAGGETLEDAEACMDALQILSEMEGNTHSLKWKYEPKKKGDWAVAVSFDITAPPSLATLLETHNGRIEVLSMAGDADLTTHNGAISAETSANRLSAKTHNGKITASANPSEVRLESHNGGIIASLDAPGEIAGRITTHNGRIEVTLGEASATNLNCSTHNGSVRCARKLDELEARRSHLRGRLGNAEAVLEIESHNGSIRVE